MQHVYAYVLMSSNVIMCLMTYSGYVTAI